MHREPVDSSFIKSVGHDPDTGMLEIEYKNGTIEQRHGVSADTHQDWMGAGSIGSHFHQHIKSQFPVKAHHG